MVEASKPSFQFGLPNLLGAAIITLLLAKVRKRKVGTKPSKSITGDIYLDIALGLLVLSLLCFVAALLLIPFISLAIPFLVVGSLVMSILALNSIKKNRDGLDAQKIKELKTIAILTTVFSGIGVALYALAALLALALLFLLD